MKLFKNLGVVALVLLVIGLSIVCFNQYSKLSKPPTVAALPVDLKQDIIESYKDSLTNQNHTKFTDKNKDLPESSLTNGAISRTLLDTISRLGIKASQVTGYQKISIVSEAKALKAEKRADSLQRIVYAYSTKYIDLSFTTPDSLHKSGEFGYRYRTEVQSVQYSPKKFLGIPIGKDVIDISATDTNATVNGLRAFSIKPRDRFFGAELQALGQYDVFNKTISPGFGVQLRFGRLYVTGGQYYNTGTGIYKTLVGTRFSIFKY